MYFRHGMYKRPSTLGVTPPSPALMKYHQATGFVKQQPVSTITDGVKEIPLELKYVQEHMAIQSLVRSYQVSNSFKKASYFDCFSK